MSGQDLSRELREKTQLLEEAIRQYGERGKWAAECEMKYRIARAKHALELRTSGVPATLIQDLCRGEPSIAKLKFEWDCAVVVHESAQEAIMSYKLQIRNLEAQIEREWKG